jgi:hypothetical protein
VPAQIVLQFSGGLASVSPLDALSPVPQNACGFLLRQEIIWFLRGAAPRRRAASGHSGYGMGLHRLPFRIGKFGSFTLLSFRKHCPSINDTPNVSISLFGIDLRELPALGYLQRPSTASVRSFFERIN